MALFAYPLQLYWPHRQVLAPVLGRVTVSSAQQQMAELEWVKEPICKKSPHL